MVRYNFARKPGINAKRIPANPKPLAVRPVGKGRPKGVVREATDPLEIIRERLNNIARLNIQAKSKSGGPRVVVDNLIFDIFKRTGAVLTPDLVAKTINRIDPEAIPVFGRLGPEFSEADLRNVLEMNSAKKEKPKAGRMPKKFENFPWRTPEGSVWRTMEISYRMNGASWRGGTGISTLSEASAEGISRMKGLIEQHYKKYGIGKSSRRAAK